MKRVGVNTLTGGEILARDLFTQNYGTILMPRGTVLKKEYIERLELLGVKTVLIEENVPESAERKKELLENCQSQVKWTLERHIYKHNAELQKLCDMAESMIMEVLTDAPISEKLIEIERSNGDMYTHSMQVCTLATILALRCGLDKRTVQDILKGGLLHDLGLRYITVKYENISIEDMPKSDQEEYRKHTLEGYAALKQEDWISNNVKDIIFYHHERLDGTGYPLQLSGDRLSVPVKIVNICDTFDEMLAGIGCKRCRMQEVTEFLRYNKGIKFDRRATEMFLKMIVQYPTGCEVKISTGEKGIVIAQNKEMPERPLLEMLYDKNGKLYSEPRKLDLMETLNIFIVESSDEIVI